MRWACWLASPVVIGVLTLSSSWAATPPAQLCRHLGTDDTLRPVPESLAPEVNAVFRMKMPPAMVSRSTVFRCVDHRVKVCTVGANLPCGKADRSRVPSTGTRAWCREHPGADFVPAAATGHDTIYEWRCRGSVPQVGRRVLRVDERGFVADFWRELH